MRAVMNMISTHSKESRLWLIRRSWSKKVCKRVKENFFFFKFSERKVSHTPPPPFFNQRKQIKSLGFFFVFCFLNLNQETFVFNSISLVIAEKSFGPAGLVSNMFL